MSAKAHVRAMLETLPYVSRTWIEWTNGKRVDDLLKTLVVEVTFDTDPNSGSYNPTAMEEIPSTINDHSTTMVFSSLRIIPKTS
jgi:hypothetical protein